MGQKGQTDKTERILNLGKLRKGAGSNKIKPFKKQTNLH